jgi:hypothetical protein
MADDMVLHPTLFYHGCRSLSRVGEGLYKCDN